MKCLLALIRRNTKLFFKDKGMFFTALITPAILLVLYATFLARVYRDSFTSNLPDGLNIPERIIDGLVGGQLVSSLLAVACVTVAFCSNFLMVQDKASGVLKDFSVSPVSGSVMALGYYISTIITTLIICLSATALCLAYTAAVGWYMTACDVALLVLDVVLLSLFGTALSSVINFFLSSQGQISAVGTVVSSGYGFICGAYMPLSSFGEGLRNVIAFLPGTYGTSLVRNHAMRGALEALSEEGIPDEAITALSDAVDCNLYFFESLVPEWASYTVVVASIVLLVGAYVIMNRVKFKKK